MGRSRGDYNSYRGRRTANDLLKIIAAVLLVLVVVVLGLLFFGQDYLVVTDKGLQFRPPFGQSQEEQPSFDPGSVSVVIQPDASQEQEEEEKEPAVEETAMTALELPLSAVLDGTAQESLDEAGANVLILEMKGTEGKLAWTSQVALAAQAGVNGQTEGVNQALETWNQGEVYTVARVCCFRDNTLPYQRNGLALRASYGNWRDELGLRWLNPDNSDVQGYLAALCGELAQMGFDEILLDCCGFPTQGNLEAIVQQGSFATGQYAQTVEAFLAQVEQAVEPYGARLSVRCGAQALTEAGSGGLDAEGLEAYADRIWLFRDGEETDPLRLLDEAGITSARERLVVEEQDVQGRLLGTGLLPKKSK